MAAQRRESSGRAYVAATAMALMLAGTLLPTPIFELYHRAWNLSPGAISTVFAVYAGSLIPSLLFLGGLSDRFGRRRMILTALGILAAGAVLFAAAGNLGWLVVARIVQGVGMGIGSGAAAAAVRELLPEEQRAHAGTIIVVAASAGSAFGALLGGVLAQYAPLPLTLPYLTYIACVAVTAIAVARLPPVPHPAPAQHAALPTIAREIRGPFAIASVQAFLGWSAWAIFIGLVPSFLARTLGLHNLLVGAFVITGLQVGSVAASLVATRLSVRTAILIAMALLGGGMWLLLGAVAVHAYAAIAIASLVAGAGGGFSYLSGLNIVGSIAPPERRAETLSAFLVACYLGFSIPALGVGLVANRTGLFPAIIGAAVLLGVVATGVVLVATERNLRPLPAPSVR